MAYTNTDTNMSTSTQLAPGMQTYYNRELLRTFEPKLIHDQWAEEYPLPPNNGTVTNLRKLIPVDAKVDPLDEGNPGDGKMISEVEVTMSVNQYGDYARMTDKLLMHHMDVNIARITKLLGDAGARAVDALCREELNKTTNVIYANGKTSRTALTANDKLTTKELRKAVKALKKAQAQTFDGWYIAIVGPDTIYDLQDDETFVAVAKYQDKEKIYTGEVGRLYGVRLIETTEAKIFTGAGNGGADIASTVVLGRYAYGKISMKGNKPRIIVKPAGSAGTNDPLDQISTVGWKLDGYGVKALQPEFMIRIESGFTA